MSQSTLWVDLPRKSRLEDYVGLVIPLGVNWGISLEKQKERKKESRNAVSLNDLPLSDLHKQKTVLNDTHWLFWVCHQENGS